MIYIDTIILHWSTQHKCSNVSLIPLAAHLSPTLESIYAC